MNKIINIINCISIIGGIVLIINKLIWFEEFNGYEERFNFNKKYWRIYKNT